MEEKKVALLKCGLRTFGAYTVISFLWLAILSLGTAAATEGNATSVSMNGISAFAERLLMANAAIALFAVVYGFSFLFFRIKSISSAAKRALHVISNYIVAMIAVLIIHSTAPNANASTWVILLFVATFFFFVIYGAAALVAFLIRRSRAK